MDEAVRKSRQKKFFEANLQFHYGIVKASGNALFVSIYDLLHGFIQETMLKTRSPGAGRGLKTINDEHRKILDAIRTGTALDAIEVVKEHLHHQKRSLTCLTHGQSGRSFAKKEKTAR
jgi:DNA-binding FadR family transcriptional regulator